MGPTSLNVNPVYGVIYTDGEFVQRGAVLGLSVDMKEVVIAPVSGWVRVVASKGHERGEEQSGLNVEIWQQPVVADAVTATSESCI